MTEIIEVGPERADDVLAVVQAAFAARPALDPPADALGETTDTIAAMLARGGGLLALDDGRPVGRGKHPLPSAGDRGEFPGKRRAVRDGFRCDGHGPPVIPKSARTLAPISRQCHGGSGRQGGSGSVPRSSVAKYWA